MFSAPTSTAPAASSRSIRVPSRGDGGSSRLIFEPARVESPCTSNRFLTANGTPASGPGFLPAATAASTARALARARSAVTSVKQLRIGSCLAIRASAASVAASADSFRPVTARAMTAADRSSCSGDRAISGCKDTGRLGSVGQREFVHQPRQPQQLFEIGPHRRLPGVVDRQAQDFRDGVDILIQQICCIGRQHSLPGLRKTSQALCQALPHPCPPFKRLIGLWICGFAACARGASAPRDIAYKETSLPILRAVFERLAGGNREYPLLTSARAMPPAKTDRGVCHG